MEDTDTSRIRKGRLKARKLNEEVKTDFRTTIELKYRRIHAIVCEKDRKKNALKSDVENVTVNDQTRQISSTTSAVQSSSVVWTRIIEETETESDLDVSKKLRSKSTEHVTTEHVTNCKRQTTDDRSDQWAWLMRTPKKKCESKRDPFEEKLTSHRPVSQKSLMEMFESNSNILPQQPTYKGHNGNKMSLQDSIEKKQPTPEKRKEDTQDEMAALEVESPSSVEQTPNISKIRSVSKTYARSTPVRLRPLYQSTPQKSTTNKLNNDCQQPNSRKLCLICNDSTPKRLALVNKFVTKFNANYVNEFESSITHVIVNTKGKKNVVKSSFKLLQGIAHRKVVKW